MNKLLGLILFIALCVINSINAKTIDQKYAETVGKNFFNQKLSVTTMTLVHMEKSNDNLPTYFVFNINGNKGFVIVSGDDNTKPIIGYSDVRGIDWSNLSPNFIYWMNEYKSQIEFVRTNNLKTNSEIKKEWKAYKNNQTINAKTQSSVSPLISTTWDQGQYYNAQCPGNSLTGCTATAMAQIMKYWDYPSQGTGSHSYYLPTYGTLSANFGATTYNWASMPNNVTSSNSAVATLMYHCGVAVEMSYSPTASAAWVLTNDVYGYHPNSAENAYVTYFNYNSGTLQGVQKMNYTSSTWINLLKNELDNSRPIQYVGWNATAGHTWVCDGYNNSDLFHMNWGWSGSSDGYFDLNPFNPFAILFGNDQQALIGIQPNSTSGCQCPISTNQFPANILTPNSSWQNVASQWAGEFSKYSVQNGETYTWTYCQSTAGQGYDLSPYDNRLNLYNDNGTYITCVTDICGLDAEITWTATFTGNVRVQTNEYVNSGSPCNTNSINSDLYYRKINGGGSMPSLTFNNYQILDGTGGGSGNSNGLAEAGEEIDMSVELQNFLGNATAHNVHADLSTTDSDITITDDSEDYPDISIGLSEWTNSDYDFDISSSCPEKDVTFSLSITSDESSWTANFVVHIYGGTIQPPNLISPNDGQTMSTGFINCDWSDVGSATLYQIEVAYDYGFTNIVYDVYNNLSQYGWNFSNPNETYYWRARAQANSIWSNWSSVWSFNTNVTTTQPPNLISPNDGQTMVPGFINCDWSDVGGA
ncbi:MAG TPA: C10 family peptidase, partial [Bacteroidia bacterium]|nr:C10 family peptidase [Bacteroidia bacterium]